jgi:hypothetical protein
MPPAGAVKAFLFDLVRGTCRLLPRWVRTWPARNASEARSVLIEYGVVV